VLYLTAHTAEAGAFGLILNRPLGRTAADVLPNHEEAALLSRVPVYLGGPVGQDQLSFAEMAWEKDLERPGKGAFYFRHNLSLEELGGLLAEETSGGPARRLRAIVGYAGWAGGQLEGELAQNAWVIVKPQRKFFDHLPSGEEKLWFGIMSSLGPAFKLLAAAPDDPSLN
jgi:putative transcriptional regulator